MFIGLENEKIYKILAKNLFINLKQRLKITERTYRSKHYLINQNVILSIKMHKKFSTKMYKVYYYFK